MPVSRPASLNQTPRGSLAPSALTFHHGNPRDEFVQGFFTQQARIMRRNLPYGPPFNPQQPNDGIERGLIGYFINADFFNQFQFLMSQWMNTDNFVGGIILGVDPLDERQQVHRQAFSPLRLPQPVPSRSAVSRDSSSLVGAPTVFFRASPGSATSPRPPQMIGAK